MLQIQLWCLLQFITGNSAGPSKASGLLAKRPLDNSLLEPQEPNVQAQVSPAYHTGPNAGISWIQAFSAAQNLANFSARLDAAEGGPTGDEVPPTITEAVGDGTSGEMCPNKATQCERSCEKVNELEIQCDEASGYALDQANEDEARQACSKGFLALKCCICYIKDEKVKETREAGKLSHRANLDYRIRISRLMNCMRALMKHKQGLLDAFQEDAKELDEEVQAQLDEVVQAAKDIKTNAGLHTDVAQEKPGSSPGEAVSAKSGNLLSSLEQHSVQVSGKTVSVATYALARQQALLKMNTRRSRVLMAIQAMTTQSSGLGDECKEAGAWKEGILPGDVGAGSLASLMADVKDAKNGTFPARSVQSLIQTTADLLQGFNVEGRFR